MLTFLLTALNLVNHKSDYTTWTTATCHRCGTGSTADVHHRGCGCPTVHHHLLKALNNINSILVRPGESAPDAQWDHPLNKRWALSRSAIITTTQHHLVVPTPLGDTVILDSTAFDHIGALHSGTVILATASAEALSSQRAHDISISTAAAARAAKTLVSKARKRQTQDRLAARADAMRALGISEFDPDTSVADLFIGETLAILGHDDDTGSDDATPWIGQVIPSRPRIDSSAGTLRLQWFAPVDSDRPQGGWELMTKPTTNKRYITLISKRSMAQIFQRNLLWESQHNSIFTMGTSQWDMVLSRLKAHLVVKESDSFRPSRAKLLAMSTKHNKMAIVRSLYGTPRTPAVLSKISLNAPTSNMIASTFEN